jgi:sensor histidine kinase YesM
LFEHVLGLIFKGAAVFLSVIILKIYFGIFFEEKQKEIRAFVVWIMYIIWQIIVSEINILPGYINVLISIAFVTIICIFSYDGNIGQMIMFSILINAIWMLVELLVGYLFLLFGVQIHYYFPQLLGSLLSKLLTLMQIIGLKKFFGNENIKSLSNKNNMVLLLIPIGSMFIVYNTFMINAFEENYQYIKLSLVSSILVLVINIIIFKLYFDLSKEKELQRHNAVYEKQLELCSQHMKEKESIMLDFRNARHDMKQHFIVLMEMLDSNQNKLAIEYLSELIDMNVLNNTGISNTDNIVVDSLINAKYSLALKHKIKFETNIHIPMQLPFESADISILLGNILDNAIEASVTIPVDERIIRCFMKYENNILIITVINSFSGKLSRNKNGKIKTTKKSPENHGIGLESIKKIASKYYGSVVVETSEEIFKIKVIICDVSKK